MDIKIEVISDERAWVHIVDKGVTRAHLMHVSELSILVGVSRVGTAADVDHPIAAVVVSNLVRRGIVYDVRHVDDGTDTTEVGQRMLAVAAVNCPGALAFVTRPRSSNNNIRKTAFFGLALSAVGVEVCRVYDQEKAQLRGSPVVAEA